MLAVLLTALLALVSAPRTQAVWLGRLDPQQVTAALLGWHRPGGPSVLGPRPLLWGYAAWGLPSQWQPRLAPAMGGQASLR